MKGYIYSKLTWKRLGMLFLVCTLFILIFVIAYMNRQMTTAMFQALVFVTSLIFGIPLIAKIGIFVYVVAAQMKLMNDKDFHTTIVKSIALKNHNENDSDMDMIIDNLYAIIKKIYPFKKPSIVKLSKNMDTLTIDGINYNLNKLIQNKDQVYMEKRIEIELLMNKKINLAELEKLLNKKIFDEWDKNKK